MKYALGLILFLIFVTPVSAYDLFISAPSEPYEIVRIEGDVEYRQVHLGSLDDYPIMYEMDINEPTTLTFSLRQPARGLESPAKLDLIIVKKNEDDGGVTDITRFNPSEDEWIKVNDKSVGVTFWDSKEIMQELEVGEYLLEVSNPNNLGKYILKMGDYSQEIGYFEELENARSIQKFLGYSIFRMLVLPKVYYPVGIALLLFFVYKVRKYRKTL